MECKIRYDTYRDARPDYLAEVVTRAVCLDHCIQADSDVMAVRDMPLTAQRDQVNERLAVRHEEMGL